MSPDRKWFTTYKEIDSGAVMMGNNNSCRTVGIGSVRIKMFDGIVRTLKDVRHVPDLRKNLISLGVLESKGCKIIAEGGALKVVLELISASSSRYRLGVADIGLIRPAT